MCSVLLCSHRYVCFQFVSLRTFSLFTSICSYWKRFFFLNCPISFYYWSIQTIKIELFWSFSIFNVISIWITEWFLTFSKCIFKSTLDTYLYVRTLFVFHLFYAHALFYEKMLDNLSPRRAFAFFKKKFE